MPTRTRLATAVIFVAATAIGFVTPAGALADADASPAPAPAAGRP